MCIDVQCGYTYCFVTNFTAEGIVHQKRLKIEDLNVGSQKNFRCLEYTEKEAQNAKGPVPASHPVLCC